MTAEQIILVKNSWKSLRQVDAALIGDLFYSKLFVENPRLKKMFPSAMAQQHKKLVDMLSFIISRLDKPAFITEDLKALALRHKDYGVKPKHYKPVGEALVWTIERGIGSDWNAPLRDAWLACYYMIAETMQSATGTSAVR